MNPPTIKRLNSSIRNWHNFYVWAIYLYKNLAAIQLIKPLAFDFKILEIAWAAHVCVDVSLSKMTNAYIFLCWSFKYIYNKGYLFDFALTHTILTLIKLYFCPVFLVNVFSRPGAGMSWVWKDLKFSSASFDLCENLPDDAHLLKRPRKN